jgi:hypothetical protein
MNFMDMALGNSDDISEFDELVLFTLHIPFDLCWVITLTKFCYDVTDLSTPQSNTYEFT